MQHMDNHTNTERTGVERAVPLWIVLIAVGIIAAVSGTALAAPLAQATPAPEIAGQTTADAPIRIEVTVVAPSPDMIVAAPSDAEVTTIDAEDGQVIPIHILIVASMPEAATSAGEDTVQQEATPAATPIDDAVGEEVTEAVTTTGDAQISMERPELQAAEGHRGPFGFGSEATQEEIIAWDNDVMPDGTGLPEGEGTVAQGAELYAAECARCHGEDGRDETYAALINPYDPDTDWPQEPLTIGNYWPYATTVYDYILRSMPYDNPNSLEPEEVYAITAWLLHENEIIEEDAVMNAETLPEVVMPAHDHFIPGDPRANYRFR